MGEVIEINIVSSEKYLLSDLLHFISLQVNDRIITKTVETMDNWQYENLERINLDEEVEKFVDNKIICVTEIWSNGQTGVNIENVNGVFMYCIWFNSIMYSSNIEYIKLIDHFIKYISNMGMLENIIIGAIGRETIFEYFNDIRKITSEAHNIDVWIIDKINYMDKIFKDYQILALKTHEKMVLTKIHDF